MISLPAIVERMPTAHRHRSVLVPVETTWRDRSGEVKTGTLPITVDRWTKLIPVADCNAIVEEMTAALQPAGAATAKRLAGVLIGSYPPSLLKQPLPDQSEGGDQSSADVYLRGIASVFETAPADVGKAAVDAVTRTQKFLPARAEVHAACAAVVAERVHARRVAEAHLAEHARRAAAVKEVADREQRSRDYIAGHEDAWHAWLKIPVLDRPSFDDFKKTRGRT